MQSTLSSLQPRLLVFRLSSLGDVILATSALETERLKATRVDWVVGSAFSLPLRGHPRVREVFEFDKELGLGGWVALCRRLWRQGYDEVLDLHGSLRTRIAQALFLLWSAIAIFSRSRPKRARWSRASKQRPRVWGYFIFKSLWPRALRPWPKAEIFSRTARGSGAERPNLRHLLSASFEVPDSIRAPFVCVMPASRWAGKQWGASRYLELVRGLGVFPVVLGTESDLESKSLVQALTDRSIAHYSAIGKHALPEVAVLLSQAEAYLGSDTGIAHLAESVGTRAWMVFGPTAADGGFGPWRKESRALGSDLWCRPCSKDGRACFRIKNRYLCLTGYPAYEAERDLRRSDGPA